MGADNPDDEQQHADPALPLSDHEVRDRFAMLASLDAFKPYLDLLDQAVADAESRGWTREQARAAIAFALGWRPEATS